ncbi:crossover junction endodeoxyribonuclease RuvA [Salmonella enterica subsp. enterica serovar Choleraesuis]|nr:crossover junction endodeoxyribonuclease RuvA [Salmonella enterica subsp. enterica serovar Choleraesuis]
MATYPITPLGKPRMTRADVWKKRPAVLRYRAFCDEVRLHKIQMPEAHSHIIFTIPMPASWSKKKRLQHDGQPHQAKPDCDNMLKALMDAIYEDDAHIWDCRITKIWGEAGQITIMEGANACVVNP